MYFWFKRVLDMFDVSERVKDNVWEKETSSMEYENNYTVPNIYCDRNL